MGGVICFGKLPVPSQVLGPDTGVCQGSLDTPRLDQTLLSEFPLSCPVSEGTPLHAPPRLPSLEGRTEQGTGGPSGACPLGCSGFSPASHQLARNPEDLSAGLLSEDSGVGWGGRGSVCPGPPFPAPPDLGGRTAGSEVGHNSHGAPWGRGAPPKPPESDNKCGTHP